jgi:hypothetical protein
MAVGRPAGPFGAAVACMSLGRTLVVMGLILVAVGLLVSFGGRLPLRLGRLPGDIYVQGKSSSFYFPITTCILVSVLFSVAMWIIRKLG